MNIRSDKIYSKYNWHRLDPANNELNQGVHLLNDSIGQWDLVHLAITLVAIGTLSNAIVRIRTVQREIARFCSFHPALHSAVKPIMELSEFAYALCKVLVQIVDVEITDLKASSNRSESHHTVNGHLQAIDWIIESVQQTKVRLEEIVKPGDHSTQVVDFVQKLFDADRDRQRDYDSQ